MIKLKKLLAGVLGAAMVLTSMSVTALADGEAMPTIDTTKKGSITINKYEGNDTSKPLADVEFTIYKIADLDQTAASPIELQLNPTVDGINSINANTTYNDVKNAVDTAIEDGKLIAAATKKTVLNAAQNTASVTFDNLALGVYLVVETDAPSQIVNKTANFLVSVPMTNADGTEWVYDITANPKNTAIYAGITLIKKGKTLKADGTTPEEYLANVTFALQKKGADNTWAPVDNYVTSQGGEGNPDKGYITVSGLAPGDYRFVETSLGGINDNKGYILDGKATYEFTVTTDGKIKIGNAEAVESGVINVNNEKPDLEKTVKNKDGSYDNDTDAAIGETVSWKVTATVPSNVDELKKYDITDQMSSSLTWESEAKANLMIDAGTATLTKDTDYTLTVPNDNTAGGTWKISFTDAGRKKLVESNVSTITVTFNTLLNENAVVGSVGNLNDAQLDYSNAIYPEDDPSNPNSGNEPGEDHIKDQAIVYTFGMDVLKVDGANDTPLENVEFDLYKYTGDVNDLTETQLKTDGTKIKSLKTDGQGKINVSGLENGDYYLIETKTVSGYNLLKKPVKVTLNVTYAVKTETTITKDAQGNVTSTTTVTTKEFNGGKDNTGRYEVQVENNKGFTLPTTGGMGTFIFTFGGIIIALAGLLLILASRKKAVSK